LIALKRSSLGLLVYESPDGFLDNLVEDPSPDVVVGRLNDTFEPDGVRALSLAGLRPRETPPGLLVLVLSENGALVVDPKVPAVPRFKLVDLRTGVPVSSKEVFEPVRLGGLLPVRLPG